MFSLRSLDPQALTDQQHFGKADEMYDKCIELEPDNATTYVHKGYSFFCFVFKFTAFNTMKTFRYVRLLLIDSPVCVQVAAAPVETRPGFRVGAHQ